MLRPTGLANETEIAGNFSRQVCSDYLHIIIPMAQVIPFRARSPRPQNSADRRAPGRVEGEENAALLDRAKTLIAEALLSLRSFNAGRRQFSSGSAVEAQKSFAVYAERELIDDCALISDHDALEWMLSDCLEILDNI